MAPGQSHRVEVEGALEGQTVADAIRFVSSGVSAPGISYVHADHLGSPQKMTDASKALVWDAVYTPFGQVHSITGTASNNQRFPGQYADAETGYSYNYFRDYDPSTGRYIQSDPIGLDGGLNTYGYVKGSPLVNVDPSGLAVSLGSRLCSRISACLKLAEKAIKACKNFRCKVALHGPHHPFGPPFDKKLPHIQLNCYIKGQKGSKWVFRVPLPGFMSPKKK